MGRARLGIDVDYSIIYHLLWIKVRDQEFMHISSFQPCITAERLVLYFDLQFHFVGKKLRLKKFHITSAVRDGFLIQSDFIHDCTTYPPSCLLEPFFPYAGHWKAAG